MTFGKGARSATANAVMTTKVDRVIPKSFPDQIGGAGSPQWPKFIALDSTDVTGLAACPRLEVAPTEFGRRVSPHRHVVK